jgi:hypothetical protein
MMLYACPICGQEHDELLDIGSAAKSMTSCWTLVLRLLISGLMRLIMIPTVY